MPNKKLKTLYVGQIAHFDKDKNVKKISISYKPAELNESGYVQSGGTFFGIRDYNGDYISMMLAMNEVTDLISRLQKVVDLNLTKELKLAAKRE